MSWLAAKPVASSLIAASGADESVNKQSSTFSNETSTSILVDSCEASCSISGLNSEKSIDSRNESKNNLEFSTISSSTKQTSLTTSNKRSDRSILLDIKAGDKETRPRTHEREHSKAAATTTVVSAHTRQKHENEAWSKTVHDMLETIVRRAIFSLVQTESQSHTSKKPRFNENVAKREETSFSLELNLDETLFEGQHESTKNKLVGSFINHNCNHINKHGVVTETDGKYTLYILF